MNNEPEDERDSAFGPMAIIELTAAAALLGAFLMTAEARDHKETGRPLHEEPREEMMLQP